MRINGTSIFSAIKLGEAGKVPREVQLFKVGKFKHPRYGEFEITPLMLQEFKNNFDNRVRGIDVAFDYYHDSDKDASGWPKSLELREDNKELWAVDVDWTPKAAAKLADRELRYFSPDFAFKWTDEEKGTTYNNVLFGGGLTNRPFLKEMKAIVADETKGVITMTELEKAQKEITDLKAANVKLSEDVAGAQKKMEDMQPKSKTEELEAQIKALQDQLAAEKAKGEVAAAEKVKADEAAKLAEKKAAFAKLLTEGKACAAQEKAFLAGDMTEFVKLAEPVNMKGKGSSGSEGSDAEVDGVLKLAEEKIKADPKLSKGDAISMARKELKKK